MKNITNNDYAALITRIGLGFIVLAHGVQKAFGWFGGYGFEGTMGFFTQTLGVPYFLGLLIIMAETVGALAIIMGLLTRFSSAAIILIMLGAIFMIHLPNGFYMNWNGTNPGEGYELHVSIIALAISLLITGAGSISLDQRVLSRFNTK